MMCVRCECTFEQGTMAWAVDKNNNVICGICVCKDFKLVRTSQHRIVSFKEKLYSFASNFIFGLCFLISCTLLIMIIVSLFLRGGQ